MRTTYWLPSAASRSFSGSGSSAMHDAAKVSASAIAAHVPVMSVLSLTSVPSSVATAIDGS